MTLSQARNALLWAGFNIFWQCAFGLDNLSRHSYIFGSLMLFLVVVQLAFLPVLWKNYRRVKQGEVISVAVSQPVHVSKIWSIIAAVLLTAIVGAETFMCWMILQTDRTNWIVWLIMAVVNLLLWAFVVYVWMRVLSQNPSAANYDAVNVEPQEGVWPPPPRLPDDERESE